MLGSMYGSTNQKDKEAEILTDASCEKRHQEYLKERKKNPHLLPVMVHAVDMEIDKKKYLVNLDVVFEKFAEISRKYCRGITETQPLFFYANDTMIKKKMTMSEIYELHKRQDEFLHITVRPEPLVQSMKRQSPVEDKPVSPEPVEEVVVAPTAVADLQIADQSADASTSTLP
jgi:hypothetical protein